MLIKDFIAEQPSNEKLSFYVKQRIPIRTFLQECFNYADKFDLLKEINAYDLKDQIISYKQKVSKAKLINKPFVDVSPCIKYHMENDDVSYLKLNYTDNRKTINIQLLYDGIICLPFKTCYIYVNCGDMIKQVMDITDNEDGTYKGILYTYCGFNQLTQFNFNISRKENYDCWLVDLNFSCGQRPLGQTLSNITTLLFCMRGLNYETAEKSQILDMDVVQAGIAENAGCIPVMLKLLSAYKTNLLYKVIHRNSDIFVYSNNTDIDKYINKIYPNCNIELQDNWIVDGYYKFLPLSQLGKDRNGKPLKGFDWIIPYENQIQLMESNNQSTNTVKIHALQRAKERYNLDLTNEDLQSIIKDCLAGKCNKLLVKNKFGQIKHTVKPNKEGCYRINYKGNIIDFVLGKQNKQYRIATLLPKPKDTQSLCIDSKDYATIKGDL